MNINKRPLTESDFKSGHNPCFTTDLNSAALKVYADDGAAIICSLTRNYCLPRRFSNPALEQEPDAPPEKMLIHFAQAEVSGAGQWPRLRGEWTPAI
jgi:hypothetical protein